jgi:dynactin 1
MVFHSETVHQIGGVKSGYLRYYGRTHFSPNSGLWCGVELDEPEGRHDGRVQGVQYFECADGHGVFAPAHKVGCRDEKEEEEEEEEEPKEEQPKKTDANRDEDKFAMTDVLFDNWV